VKDAMEKGAGKAQADTSFLSDGGDPQVINYIWYRPLRFRQSLPFCFAWRNFFHIWGDNIKILLLKSPLAI